MQNMWKLLFLFYSLSEEHIKQDINNYFLNNNVCELHKEKIIYYCIDFNLYLCGTCSENGSHKEHEIKDIKSLILPKGHIDEIYNRIKDYDALIKKIDSWIDWYKSGIILKIIERLKKSINEKNNRKNDV